VIIVGGGIAGSALAIAMARRGARVVLLEREQRWAPHSSGIFIYCNGLQALDRLGVLDEICRSGWVSPDGDNLYLAADGSTITRTTYPGIGDRIPPIVGIRRAELHRVLATAVAALGIEVRLATTVTAFEDCAPAPVQVTLSGGARLECDLLVGADGIRSDLRRRLFGELEPVYTGLGVWRSMHAKPSSIETKIMMMGVGTRLGIMPLSNDQLYMFGTTREPGKPHYPREAWARQMRDKFADFKGPAEVLLAQIETPDQVYYTPIEEVHLPLPWSRGRAVVIGDAAHSSSPFMGQGGAMALEDAVVLADMIAPGADIAATLSAFGRRRFERCRFVQEASRRVGEAGATETLAATVARDERMRRTAQSDVDQFYARMLEAA
jgi:2-polyprenyl-6-methoxyphenol hydroxylase-like FAD-dependent oxidoreductase